MKSVIIGLAFICLSIATSHASQQIHKISGWKIVATIPESWQGIFKTIEIDSPEKYENLLDKYTLSKNDIKTLSSPIIRFTKSQDTQNNTVSISIYVRSSKWLPKIIRNKSLPEIANFITSYSVKNPDDHRSGGLRSSSLEPLVILNSKRITDLPLDIQNFNVEVQPKTVQLNHLKTIHTTISYYKNDDTKNKKILLLSWYVKKGNYLFLIRATVQHNQFSSLQKEINTALNKIEINYKPSDKPITISDRLIECAAETQVLHSVHKYSRKDEKEATKLADKLILYSKYANLLDQQRKLHYGDFANRFTDSMNIKQKAYDRIRGNKGEKLFIQQLTKKVVSCYTFFKPQFEQVSNIR